MDSKYFTKIRQAAAIEHFSMKMGGWIAPAVSFICIVVFSLLSGCASLPIQRVEKVPIDKFQAYSEPDGTKIYPESVDKTIPDVDILAINHKIKSILDNKVLKIKNPRKRLEALKNILLQKIRYDTVEDRYGAKTAQETFDTGTGNCLSFSNLFVAMARYAGFKARYQEIPTLPNWVREGEVLFFTRHIGVSVDINEPYEQVVQLKILGDNARVITMSRSFRFFFAPSELYHYVPEINPYSFHPIPDYCAFAQYYNNIGSQRLAEGNNADAFRYFVKAIKTDPRLGFAWSNLGVLYGRNNQLEASEQAYLQGLAVTRDSEDPTALTIMNNMANLYDKAGDKEKAEFYRKRVKTFMEKNPYYQYVVAKTAYFDAFYEKAVRRFKEAIRLKKDEPIFYHGLALAYLKMGDIKKAEKSIGRAIHYSWSEEKKAYYERIRDTLSKNDVD